MKRVIFFLIGISLAGCLMAQPTKSRVRNNNTKAAQKETVTDRASLMFPTAVAVPEDVAWRRDIYRSLDLKKDENAALYYPVEPQGDEVNLFTLMFRLFNTGKLPIERIPSDCRNLFFGFVINFTVSLYFAVKFKRAGHIFV